MLNSWRVEQAELANLFTPVIEEEEVPRIGAILKRTFQ